MSGKRKGSWTPEEDNKLVNCINLHGPGRWDYLAECAGLERSGKSCRLRWLNYLRPDLRHDDITLEEQLHIIELQLEWGNKWAKIAESLPGRTDNDVKNYWRTRVHKRAQDLNCDIDSPQFKHIMINSWMPRLAEQIQTTFRYDDPVESSPTSMVINNIRGRPSIIQEDTIHSSNKTSSSLENEGQTRRLGNHAGGHLIKWDEISSLTQQSPAGSGDGSQCSRIQMDTYTSPLNTTCSTHFFHGDIFELDYGPFGLNHYIPDGRLPSLNCSSSPLSSDVHLSPASEPTHNLTGGHDIFQLDQNDYGLKKTQDGSVSEPELFCDGGIVGHEVDNILANFELLMSDENMIRDLQQLLFDDDLN